MKGHLALYEWQYQVCGATTQFVTIDPFALDIEPNTYSMDILPAPADICA
jgi:hypothetical protein